MHFKFNYIKRFFANYLYFCHYPANKLDYVTKKAAKSAF